jgi:hypothetical protein
LGSNINTGNITGSGIIVGNDIHIEGDLIVQTSDKARSLGINLLEPKYFQNRSIGDVENWKNGFEFELPDIMAGLEFKRENLLTSIIKKLDDNKTNNAGGHSVLLLGKSGISKSTILKELICHYFKEQYIVLYNFGEEKIDNVFGIVNFIESKLNAGKVENRENKILVAVDNVHNERTASIFSVIDQFDNHIKKDNLRFILTARQPEFDRFIESRLSTIPEQIRNSINKLLNNSALKFEIGSFDESEIEGFIKKYKNAPEILDSIRRIGFYGKDLIDDKKLKNIASQIYNETHGDPILVKFLLFGEGLLQDVKKRYRDYLAGNEDKLTSNNLFDIK